MVTFLSLAYEILKDAGKPLHVNEITRRALHAGLVTEGKTPAATMNARIIVDINKKKEKSVFIKEGPSTFAINPLYDGSSNKGKALSPDKIQTLVDEDKQYQISPTISSKQKGDIVEARIAELITLYGEMSLSCYKPISDDEGIDLIVKQKGSFKTMYFQIKSRFTFDASKSYTATVKSKNTMNNHSMGIIFCVFDLRLGDIGKELWYVPATDFLKYANKLNGGTGLGFVSGRGKKESNKRNDYLLDKRDLANKIIEEMKKI